MKKFIVITSVFKPTAAVVKFSRNEGYQVVVVGDKKTPIDWHCENVEFISIEQQKEYGFQLCDIMPYNHYCRKMFGYLYAIRNGADVIIDTDDDNIPKERWNFPKFDAEYDFIAENKGFINIYQLYTQKKIWPRGLPLSYINKNTIKIEDISKRILKVGIWQGLADEDPDVDAIYRLTNNDICIFQRKEPYVLGKGTVTPLNSQNTAIRKELFVLLYLPTYVTFRFTDILRGLIAQPIMWLYDYHVGFIDATVLQKRNEHNLFKDFELEIPMYLYAEKVFELVSASITSNQSIENNLFNAYMSLLKENIVSGDELKVLKAWMNDINHCLTLYKTH